MFKFSDIVTIKRRGKGQRRRTNALTKALAKKQAEIEIYKDPTLILGPNIVTSIVNQITDNFSGSKIALGVSMEQLAAAGLVLSDAEINAIISDYVAAVTAVDGEAGLLQVQSATGEEQEAFTVVGIITPIMAAMSNGIVSISKMPPSFTMSY